MNISTQDEKDMFFGYVVPATIIYLILMLSLFLSTPAHSFTDEEIVNAIYKAEGVNARYQYGIRSVNYGTVAEARQICLRTVRNNRNRWETAGRPNDFLSFLASKYCPQKADNDPRGLNRNWLRNVRFFLAKEGK